MQASKVIAAMFAASAVGAAQADTTFFEGFEDVASLSSRGWEVWNLSQRPNGPGWFQGSGAPFEAASGPATSYVATNYLTTVRGDISTWLVTPEIHLTGSDVLSFSIHGIDAPWVDHLRVLVGSGSADAPEDFTTPVFEIAGVPPTWITINPQLPQWSDSVRVAFEYFGTFQSANYIGLDSVSVTSAVPEPTSALLFGLGLAGVALQLRRRAVTTV